MTSANPGPLSPPMGVYRVTGSAATEAGPRSWSLVLKVLGRRDHTELLRLLGPEYSDSLDPLEFWTHEHQALQSELLRVPTGGFVPVRCHAAKRNTDTIQLWLEDAREPDGADWALPRHVLAARHLGQFNGAHRNVDTASHPWLLTNMLRLILVAFSRGRSRREQVDWRQPSVSRVFPAPLGERIARILDRVESWLVRLAQQPQSLAHQDTDRRNLFSRVGAANEDETVAIDWGFMGVAAIGEDLGNQVFGNLFFLFVDSGRAVQYLEEAVAAYLDGLRDAGCVADPGDVRLAALAHTLQYLSISTGWIHELATGAELPGMLQPAYAAIGSVEETWSRWGEAVHAIVDAAEEVEA